MYANKGGDDTLQEVSKVAGGPHPQPVLAHSSPPSPGNPIDNEVAAPSSNVHPYGGLPDAVTAPVLDAPAQLDTQQQSMDLSSAVM